MLKKALITLKNNPMIIVVFIIALVISVIPVIFLLPDVNKIMAISNDIARNSTDPSAMNPQEIIEMLASSIKMLLYSLIACGFGIVFIAGFGNMLAAAANEGKASLKIFFFGIRKFFGKTFLSFLLLFALIFGISMVISIITIPFTITNIMNRAFDPETMLSRQKIMQIISSVMMFFLYPFVLLWLPAVFLDRNDGVIACFRNGVKAGVKKYLLLLAVIAVMFLPTIALVGFTRDLYTMIQSPFYILMIVYQAIVMPISLTYLFTLYNEMRRAR